jgi:hypothetical protein
VICAKSRFFQAAWSDHGHESQEKVVRLPEARSKGAFQVYLDWSYKNKMAFGKSASPEVEEDVLLSIMLREVLTGYDLRSDITCQTVAARQTSRKGASLKSGEVRSLP